MTNIRPRAGRPKGQPRTGGRQKGSLNKTTIKVREALEQTFEHLGGVEFMMEWAKQEPTEFMKLYIKLLPVQVQADVRHDGVVSFVVETGIRRAPDEPIDDE